MFPGLCKLKSGDEIHNTRTVQSVGSLSLHSDRGGCPRGGCSRGGARPLRKSRGMKERVCSKNGRGRCSGQFHRVQQRACFTLDVMEEG